MTVAIAKTDDVAGIDDAGGVRHHQRSDTAEPGMGQNPRLAWTLPPQVIPLEVDELSTRSVVLCHCRGSNPLVGAPWGADGWRAGG